MSGQVLTTEATQQEDPPALGTGLNCLLWILGGVAIGLLIPQATKGEKGG